MFGHTQIYGLDIETDNTPCETVCETYAGKDRCYGHGLDPRRSAITEVAVATDPTIYGGGKVFAGHEIDILANLQDFLTSLPAGLLVTWNGAMFDIPYLADRAAVRDFGPTAFTLRTAPAPDLVPKYEPLPGHAGGYTATWDIRGQQVPHQHLDVAWAYKAKAAELDVSWSLKPVCAALGVPMYEIDRTRLHEYTPAQVAEYCLSDASGTRVLAMKALGN